MEFYHSAKGTTWKNHKYIAIKNGRYIYPSKSQGASARKKINQLSSRSSNIVKDSVKNNLRDTRDVKDSAISIALDIGKIGGSISNTPIEKYTSSMRKAIDDLKSYAEKAAMDIAINEATEKAAKAGEKAINQILGTNFKLTGVIDMEGRGLKKDTKVTLGPIKYSEPKKRR